MDNNNKFQTTFIPKKPIVSEPTRSDGGISIFLLISIILFVGALAASGYVYFQQKSLAADIVDKQAQLKAFTGEFETNTIESLIALDSKLKVSKEILTKHVVTSPVFAFLEAQTVAGIRFKNFTYSNNNNNDLGTITLKMSGVAKDFKTIAFQSDTFSQSLKIIKNPIFSDFSPNTDGTVSFSFTCDIASGVVSYPSLFIQDSASVAPKANTDTTSNSSFN